MTKIETRGCTPDSDAVPSYSYLIPTLFMNYFALSPRDPNTFHICPEHRRGIARDRCRFYLLESALTSSHCVMATVTSSSFSFSSLFSLRCVIPVAFLSVLLSSGLSFECLCDVIWPRGLCL